MRRLVSDLLLLARADAGRAGAAARAATSPRSPPRRSPRCGRSPTATSSSSPTDGPVTVEGNPDELHRLVAQPARERRPPHARRARDRRSRSTAATATAVLEVSDDGPGPPAGVGEQIFSRFVRGDGPGRLSGDSGTGLGLAIVKAVADVARRRGRARALGRRRGPVHRPAAARASRRRNARRRFFSARFTRSVIALRTWTRHRPARLPPTVPRRASIGQF